MRVILREEQLSKEDNKYIEKISIFPNLAYYFKDKVREQQVKTFIDKKVYPQLGSYKSGYGFTGDVGALILEALSYVIQDYITLFGTPRQFKYKSSDYVTIASTFNRKFGTISCTMAPLEHPTKHMLDLNFFLGASNTGECLAVLYGYAENLIQYIKDNNITDDLVLYLSDRGKYMEVKFEPEFLHTLDDVAKKRTFMDILKKGSKSDTTLISLLNYIKIKYATVATIKEVV